MTEIGLFGSTPLILTTTNRRAVDHIVGPDLWHLQELIEWRVEAKRSSSTSTRH